LGAGGAHRGKQQLLGHTPGAERRAEHRGEQPAGSWAGRRVSARGSWRQLDAGRPLGGGKGLPQLRLDKVTAVGAAAGPDETSADVRGGQTERSRHRSMQCPRGAETVR
jgi:hypothetical protein